MEQNQKLVQPSASVVVEKLRKLPKRCDQRCVRACGGPNLRVGEQISLAKVNYSQIKWLTFGLLHHPHSCFFGGDKG